MSKKVPNTEKEISKVLKLHDDQLKSISFPDQHEMDLYIDRSVQILRDLGYVLPLKQGDAAHSAKEEALIVPSWRELCEEADRYVTGDSEIESLFTPDELRKNEEAIALLNKEFNQIHHLDKVDIAIGVLAGMVGAAVDILMIGIPQKSGDGLKAGSLSDFIRDYFDSRFPESEMKKLANSKVSKVPYDAQDNRHTAVYVQGLSAYYHRLLQLGHDPVLGFVFGVADILNGGMTTIDKNGKIVSQVMENYAERKETEIFAALAKQIVHLKTDVTTSMGLPAPFMSLFNLLQFGKIGEYEQTIAEIVQGMYYEGYDFIHFCSMSVSTMLVEVIIRMGYAFKRISEGYSVKDSIPVSLNRDKHPKLATMLFMGHSAATAINSEKVIFTKNSMSINYPQWLAFLKYSYLQMKWVLREKPKMKDAYISGRIYEEMQDVYDEADRNFAEYTRGKIVIFS